LNSTTTTKVKCQPCGLDAKHSDIADCMRDCMRDLMRYLEPHLREDPKVQAVIDAGYLAMKRELDNQHIGEESSQNGRL